MQRQSLYFISIFAILAGLTVWTLRRPAERGMQRIQISAADVRNADRIEVSGAHQAVLHRQGDVWYLQSKRKADAQALSRTLDELSTFASSDWLTNDAARFEELGVSGSQATQLRLERQGKTLLTLSFGETQGPEVMVRQGDDVFRGHAAFPMMFARGEQDWLDRHLLDLSPEDLQRIELRLKDAEPMTLAWDTNTQAWTLANAPTTGGYRFDPIAASSLANILANTQLSAFIDVDPGAETTGLADGVADVVAFVGAHKTDGDAQVAPAVSGELRLGATNPEGDVYARISGREELFTIAGSQAAALRKRLPELRALNVMAAVDFDTIVQARIETAGGKTLRFSRADGTWQMLSAKPSPAFVLDTNKLQARLRKTLLARAIGIADGKPSRVAQGGGRIVLTAKDGKTHVLSFGGATDGGKGQGFANGYYAQGSADNNVYRISKPLHDDLLADAQALSRGTPPNAAAKANPATGIQGLDSLPADVRANIERQLAAQQPSHSG